MFSPDLRTFQNSPNLIFGCECDGISTAQQFADYMTSKDPSKMLGLGADLGSRVRSFDR